MPQPRRSIAFVLLVLVACLFARTAAHAFGPPPARSEQTKARSGPRPATSATTDDAVCASCHTQATGYGSTGHHITSALATEPALAPLFRLAGSSLTISAAPLPSLRFLLGDTAGHPSETAITAWAGDPAGALHITEPIDLIVGSGKRGQTFLFWSGNRLFELPISYWKDGHRWINSPGYIDGTADFHRPVQPGCLECHATAITPLSTDAAGNSYQPASLVTGIACSTCHGPGAAHVAAERAAAAIGRRASDPAILNPARFPRDRQVDLCALCHSGTLRVALQPAFSFVPGDLLSHYFQPLPGAADARPDVHGNQVGLLERSRCYLASPAMSCSTCHDVHTAGQPVAAYAARCLNCHQWQSCGEARHRGASIRTECIGCHMPVQQTAAIISVTAGERVQASMRTHWIKVYPGLPGAAAERSSLSSPGPRRFFTP